MSKAIETIAKRRAYLIEQSAQQRAKVVACVEPLRSPFAIADKAIAVVHYLKHHPLMLLGSGMAYTAYRAKGANSWSKKAWLILTVLSKAKQFIKQAQLNK